jgi:hypothetical protein
MDAETFKSWLTGHPMCKKAQGNAVSNCRRVERLTDLDLDDVVTSDSKMAEMFLWLAEHAPDYVEGELTEHGAASLMSAVRTYADFRCSTKARSSSNSH